MKHFCHTLFLFAILTVAATSQTQVALINEDQVPAGFEAGIVYPITDIERLHQQSPSLILTPIEAAAHLPMEERKGKRVVFLSAEVPTATPLWEIQLHREPFPMDTNSAQDDTFVPLEKQPEFDMELLKSSIRYPEQAKVGRIEGSVIVGALIGPDGLVERLRIEKSDHEALNGAAAAAVAITPFSPGLAEGDPTRVWIWIPVLFKLD